MALRVENPCPIARALHIVGERWTLLIIRDLLRGPGRFQEFTASMPGISPTILTKRLKTLEEYGLIKRQERNSKAGGIRYEITDMGRALAPTVKALGDFGRYHIPS